MSVCQSVSSLCVDGAVDLGGPTRKKGGKKGWAPSPSHRSRSRTTTRPLRFRDRDRRRRGPERDWGGGWRAGLDSRVGRRACRMGRPPPDGLSIRFDTHQNPIGSVDRSGGGKMRKGSNGGCVHRRPAWFPPEELGPTDRGRKGGIIGGGVGERDANRHVASEFKNLNGRCGERRT